jgi:beta-galactosidase/beta-glucuronidase
VCRKKDNEWSVFTVVRNIRSLNGQWAYSVNRKEMGLISVPFSALCAGESECALTFGVQTRAPHCRLCFEGITYRATVTLNGRPLGTMCPYSYHAFDVSDVLLPGENRLVVTLQDMNLPFGPSEGWENYGGIIRDVYLLFTDSVYVDDVVWRTSTAPDFGSAECGVEVRLAGGDGEAQVSLRDARGFEVARGGGATAGGTATVTLHVDRPMLWSPDFPYLYTLAVRVGDDELVQKVGVKDFHIEGQRFVLNGKPLFLKGVLLATICGGRQGHNPHRGPDAP